MTDGGKAMKKQYKVHLDEGLKTEADALFESMGLSFSTAVGLFLAATLKGELPFKVAATDAARERAAKARL